MKLLKEDVLYFKMYKQAEVDPSKIHPRQGFENSLKPHKLANQLRIYK
jgi:hypothetical protein